MARKPKDTPKTAATETATAEAQPPETPATDAPPAPTESAPPQSVTKKVRHLVRHYYTLDERIAEGSALSEVMRKMESTESRAKSVRDHFKAELSELVERAKLHRMNFDNGFIERDADCDEVLDYAAGTAAVLHPETGEILEERRLRADEMQKSLFGDGDGEAAADGPDEEDRCDAAVEAGEAFPDEA